MRLGVYTGLILLSSCLVCPDALGLTETRDVGTVSVTVYAPDWSWQQGAVNVLVTLENSGSDPVDCKLSMLLPESSVDHFVVADGFGDITVTVSAGETTRAAFTNLVPKSGHELQVYPLQITARVGEMQAFFEYPLQTIRGPMVSGAQWAMFLPAVICVLWCVTFIVALRRFATPGAWKTPAALSMDDTAHEAWMDETP